MGGASGGPPKLGDGCMRISEAGVAGVLLWLLYWAIIAGD
jgi:hypothetical protein